MEDKNYVEYNKKHTSTIKYSIIYFSNQPNQVRISSKKQIGKKIILTEWVISLQTFRSASIFSPVIKRKEKRQKK